MKNSFIFIVFTSLILLTGCIEYEQWTTIKSDSSGDMYIHYSMPLAADYDSSKISSFIYFNPDSLTRLISTDYTEVIKIQVYLMPDSSIHTSLGFKYNHLDSLNNLPLLKNAQISLKEGPDKTLIFSQYINSLPLFPGLDVENFKYKYTFHFPGKIIRHNASSQNKNTLIWDFANNEVRKFQTLNVTYRPFKLKETPPFIHYAMAGIIAIVIYFLFRKRKG